MKDMIYVFDAISRIQKNIGKATRVFSFSSIIVDELAGAAPIECRHDLYFSVTYI